MEEIKMLEMEIKLLQDNIKRIKEFIDINKNEKWTPYSSNVIGEFKHRLISLKARITITSKIVTHNLFNK